ncbi:Ca-activated chloride channel family protein [Kribbella orskensis]|uniref:Ca-activated chloride channel family protein n=1 Tax=Kribbella orskensis TaxID=2512216 RepID=A0ABY2BMQ6_9ACTN|nr:MULTISPECIES: VIT domain-containing protein [Kribbella]TCN41145.1 Ca-activated chloride channel family protein [Kribbella sp. VKM Ac-2500]TCO24397.1 Ca-activated chloride channel family protein [Kribbella orskensis]
MTVLPTVGPAELRDDADDAGLGALQTERGNLPLERIDVHATITGLVARTVLTQDFHNPHDVPLEATYIFPLPDRAAVTGLRMTADDRTVDAELQERAEARATYDAALAAGQRASIAEEERPDVFTLRVGNIVPGERVTVRLTLVGPLPYEDGEATYRLPLVVAPRYIPGALLPSRSVGDGVVPDTDAVPDASRITPPILLPGFPNPVRLSIRADVDPAGLPLHGIRSSLHAIGTQTGDRMTSVAINPGERVDRDFILRLAYGEAEVTAATFTVEPDQEDEGTFELTVLPPLEATVPRPRDVVLVLDRSGSMSGWKMVAARRAAARIVDTLTAADRFAVLTFDTVVERPAGLPEGLSDGTDRHRFRAVEHLAGVTARGGTELLAPLREAAALLSTDGERDRVLVLVTDGQVGNEDQILSELGATLGGLRIHTVGIDRAVNAGFLGRLAGVGGGRCELVESEERLDEALDRIHRRIGTPLLTNLALSVDGFTLLDDSLSPARMPDAFARVPLVLRGRYRGSTENAVARLHGITAAGEKWQVTVPAVRAEGALAAVWARSHLRDLEDQYAVGAGDSQALEHRIVAVSLRHHVLCRFTALVAVDSRVVAEGGPQHRVVQPVELPSGWDLQQFSGLQFAGPAAARPAGDAAMPLSRSLSSAPLSSAPPSYASPAGHALGARRAQAGGFHLGIAASRGELDHDARTQLAAEAQLLRNAGTPTTPERLTILSDLASRILALIQQVGPQADPLRELAAALATCEGPNPPRDADLDALWQRALDVLDKFAGTPPTPHHFWKRR